MVKFRFQDLKIWQLAIEIADALFDIADDLEGKNCSGLLSNSEAQQCQCPIILPRDLVHHQKENLTIF